MVSTNYYNARLKNSRRSLTTMITDAMSSNAVCMHLLSGWVENISLKYPAVI